MRSNDEQNTAGYGTLKQVDAWWTVLFIDPLAVRLVTLVENRPRITPNRITVVAHAMGVLTAFLFVVDQPVVAAALYEVRFVLDCCDGKLARRRRESSEAGAYLDYVGDILIAGANFAALGVWLHWHEQTTVVLAVALPVSLLMFFFTLRMSSDASEMRFVSDAMPGRYRAWMAARRLRPTPSRIDVEHGVLFGAPCLSAAIGDGWPTVFAAVCATLYLLYSTLRVSTSGFVNARARDRHQTPRPGNEG